MSPPTPPADLLDRVGSALERLAPDRFATRMQQINPSPLLMVIDTLTLSSAHVICVHTRKGTDEILWTLGVSAPAVPELTAAKALISWFDQRRGGNR